MSTTSDNKRGRPTSWVYRVRAEGAGGALTVPRIIYSQIPKGTLFRLSVTPEGLLYEITNESETNASDLDIPWGKPQVNTRKKER